MAVATLIVDDSADTRTWLKHHLEELGCNMVGEAANAAEGMRLFEALRPQLVTLDIVMPDIDGMTAMDLFRRISHEDADTSVLIVSVRPLRDSHDFLKMGAIGYLEKPFIDFEQAGKLLRDCFPELELKVPPVHAKKFHLKRNLSRGEKLIFEFA